MWEGSGEGGDGGGGRCLRRCGREEEPVFLSTSSHKSIGFQANNDEDGEKCRDYDEGGGEEKTEERGFGANSEKAHIKPDPNSNPTDRECFPEFDL